jgi:hypothetical protein
MGFEEAITVSKDVKATIKIVNGVSNSDAAIKNWLFSKTEELNKFVCLILGSDGTGKSPLALSYMSDEDIKAGKRCVIIDLDGGNTPLINKYQAERCKNLGREAQDVFIVKNPLTETATENGYEIDYLETFSKIKGVVKLLKDEKLREEYKIKYFVLDGLSTLLKHAENQMRLDRHLAPDGGVQTRFWLVRNKVFIETIESIKSLPISSFFIAHEDFILKSTEDNPAVKEKVNQLVHQKIKCEKIFSKGKTEFKATILKSKYNVRKEGKEIIFGAVDLVGDKVTFNPEIVFDGLL